MMNECNNVVVSKQVNYLMNAEFVFKHFTNLNFLFPRISDNTADTRNFETGYEVDDFTSEIPNLPRRLISPPLSHPGNCD